MAGSGAATSARGGYSATGVWRSTFQGLGASEPMKGTVGRVAAHLAESSGRPVHIVNRSVTGAIAQSVVDDQLGAREVEATDIIIVAVAANDINRESKRC